MCRNIVKVVCCSWNGGELGSAAGQFSSPAGIAIDSAGNVFVADSVNNRIQQFDQNGNYLGEWGALGSGNAQFDFPAGIAIASDGTIYVVDTNNGRVQMFDTTGSYTGEWGSPGLSDGEFSSPSFVAIDSTDNIYVADQGNDRVQKFTTGGVYLSQWGASGAANGEFFAPTGLALDPGGNIFVVDSGNNRIQVFSPSGSYITQWGVDGSGNGQFNNPQGIGIGSDGTIYVADRDNLRIQEFNDSMDYEASWYVYGYQLPSASDIAVDSSDSIYVSTNSHIKKYTSDGFFIDQWSANVANQGAYPRAIAIDQNDTVYLTKTENAGNAISQYSSNGTLLSRWQDPVIDGISFYNSSEIAASQDGVIYANFVTDPTYAYDSTALLAFDQDGTVLDYWLAPDESIAIVNFQFSFVKDLYVDDLQFLYLLTTDAGIVKLNPDGTNVTSWGGYGSDDGHLLLPLGLGGRFRRQHLCGGYRQ